MSETNRGRVRVETSAKRVRAFLNGEAVVDSAAPLLVWESPYFPTYYFPASDVRADLLTATGKSKHSPSRGDTELYTVTVGDKKAEDAAARVTESPFEELRGTIRLDWNAMDTWFEEDEEVFTHARSPYTRIDILPSSRHVRVELDGELLAESNRPFLLFETGLPVRYYLPKLDARPAVLEHTDSETHCPYKGQAEYWSVRVGDKVVEDAVWSYPTPLPESERIAGLVSFDPSKVTITVDGTQLEPR